MRDKSTVFLLLRRWSGDRVAADLNFETSHSREVAPPISYSTGVWLTGIFISWVLVSGFYSCALMKVVEDGWGTSALAALKLEMAYSGRMRVTVAIASPTRLAIWPGGGSDGRSGLAGSMEKDKTLQTYLLILTKALGFGTGDFTPTDRLFGFSTDKIERGA